jgi:hypothetical protein
MAQPQPSQQQQPSTAVGGALTYADSVCAIRIQYPSSWEATGLGSDGAQFHAPKTSNGLSISISPSSSPSLDTHARTTIDSLRKDLGQNFQLIRSGTTTLAGNPAHVIEYRFKEVLGGFGVPGGNEEQPKIMKTMDIFTIKGDKLYTLSYSVPEALYPQYLSTINSMISTFAIGNPSTACRPQEAILGFGGGFGPLPSDEFGGGLAPFGEPPTGPPTLDDGGGFGALPSETGPNLPNQQQPPGPEQQ